MNGQATRSWIAFLVLLIGIVYAIRMTEPNDYEADAQDRNIGYVMDVLWHGHWLVQTDVRDRIMSKPPLHTWLTSAVAAVGGINRMTLTLPSALAVLGTAIAVFLVGRRRFGLFAGGCAGLAIVLAPMMTRHIVLVRTDALFAFFIALTAFAAYRAWERGSSWISFWLAAAAATLTKGPLGLLLGATGLLAWFWERRNEPDLLPPQGKQQAGITLYLAVTLGWLLLGVMAEGYQLFDKLFFAELLGQATGLRKDISPGENLYKPIFFLTLRMLPFSLFAWLGLWRVYARPAADPDERRFERFLFCGVASGLVIFSLAAHFRADLLLPLWPLCALLAGREMARIVGRIGRPLTIVAGVALVGGLLGATAWNYMVKHAHYPKEVRYTLAAEAAAHALQQSGLDLARLQHLDTPLTLQLMLGTYRYRITEQKALELVSGQEPVLLAVESPKDFPALFGADAPPLRKVFETPGLMVYGN